MASNQAKGALGGAASGASQGFAASGGNPWGAAVGGVIGGIGGLLGGGAADDAEKLAKDQAKFMEMETAENVRRMRMAAQEQVGLSRATAYASNLQGDSGSSGKYTNKIRSQWENDIAWKQYAGKKQAEFTREGGAAASSGIMTNMFLQNAQTALSAGATYAGQGGFSRPPQKATPTPGGFNAPLSLAVRDNP
jgi:hypothetical protein